MSDPKLKLRLEAAYEAIGRILHKESVGESDMANIAIFSHHWIEMMKGDEWVPDPVTLPEEPIISMCAKSGPAWEPYKEMKEAELRWDEQAIARGDCMCHKYMSIEKSVGKKGHHEKCPWYGRPIEPNSKAS